MSREIFAKMAGTLDSNRKIRKAGRDGRDVFLWVLRQVALRDSDGSIPTDDLTDFDYLADQLMCSRSEAERGYRAAIAVGLLVTDNARSVTRIVGWSGDWGRRPRSNAERQADYRARHGSEKAKKPVDDGDVTEPQLPVTADVTSNPVEESRVEEIRVEERRERGAVTAPALPGFEPPPGPAPKSDIVADLWAEQERLRKEVLPRSIGLDLTADRRKRIGGLLKSGHSADSLMACLRSYADEARTTGDGQHFNGDTNWRPDNVARTLGRIGTRSRDAPRPHAPAQSLRGAAAARAIAQRLESEEQSR